MSKPTEMSSSVSKTIASSRFLALALLKGKIIERGEASSIEELIWRISSLKPGTYLVTASSGNYSLRLLYRKGSLIGIVSIAGDEVYYGEEALAKTMEKGPKRLKYLAYLIPDDFIDSILAEEAKKPTKPRQPVETMKVKEPKPPETKAVSEIPDTLRSTLTRLGLSVSRIDAEYSSGKVKAVVEINNPRDFKHHEVAWMVASSLSEAIKPNSVTVDVVLKGKRRTFSFEGESLLIALMLAKAVETLVPNNLHVDSYRVEWSKGTNDLTLRLFLRKVDVIPAGRSLRDLARECYDKMKEFWRGNLTLYLRLGRLGLEERYP